MQDLGQKSNKLYCICI